MSPPAAGFGEERPAVVLVRPQEEGNIGAVARAMSNLGLERLLLVAPAAALGNTAYAFAMHAHPILDRAERHPDLGTALAGFHFIVGTASLRDRGWAQPILAPRELPSHLARHAAGARVALVFGSEVSGLTREELVRASVLVRIPAAVENPTLNLAQAVLLVAYELHLARGAPSLAAPEPVARATVFQQERLFRQLATLLADVGFARDTTIVRVEQDLRQLFARAELTERESMILAGILRRARHALARRARAPREPGAPAAE